MSFGCFVFFLLVPVAPPWLASQRGYLPHVQKIISSTIPSQTTFYYQHLNPNPVAAFPSLHEAFPVLGLLYGAHYLIDTVMVAVAQWSEPFFIALVLAWFLLGLARGIGMEREGAVAALVASGLALAVNQMISQLWFRPRPFAAHPGAVRVLLAHSADASFPSDHVAAAVAISVVLWFAHRRLGLMALVLSAAIGYARVFVGDHYPGDVVGGATVGAGAGLIMVSPWVRGLISKGDGALAGRRLGAGVTGPRDQQPARRRP